MDRISGLSDELLLKILLLVPTKVAVSTSILSKRWRYLWMWLPRLEFRYKRLLDPECESMWVSIALSHCLRELEIARGSDSAKPVILPSDLFTCKSLVVLKLVGVILLDVPRILVSLPSLKTLKLQSLKYFNEETLQRLLSNCPILEDLVVDLRDGDTTGKLTVVVPSLLSFSLYIPYYHHIDGYVIETPSLKYFKLRDHHRNDDHYCLIENMPHLVEAYLDVNLTDIKSLIGSITSVKHLEICSLTMLDEGFVFNQLEHLDLCLCPKHSSNNQLVRLLKSSPNLQGLHLFFVKYGHCFEFMGEWNQPTTVPECISSSLQKSEMLKELELSPRASAACRLMFE
ncbi:hypothetical protein Bca4012_021419 [Brassica carinata]